MDSQIDKFNARKAKTEELKSERRSSAENVVAEEKQDKQVVNDLSRLDEVVKITEVAEDKMTEENTSAEGQSLEERRKNLALQYVSLKDVEGYDALMTAAINGDASAEAKLKDLLEQSKSSDNEQAEVGASPASEVQERQADEHAPVDEPEKKGELTFDDRPAVTNSNENDWVERYNKHYAAEDATWKRNLDPSEEELENESIRAAVKNRNALYGQNGSGVKYLYTAADRVSVDFAGRTPEPKDFDAAIKLAIKEGQQVSLGSIKSPEFRKALLTSAVNNGAEINRASLSKDDQDYVQGLKNGKETVEKEIVEKDKQEGSPVTAPYVQNVYRFLGRKDDVALDEKIADLKNGISREVGEDGKVKTKENGINAAIGDENLEGIKLTLAEYVKSQRNNDTERKTLLEKALKKYDIDSISKDERGEPVVTVKKFGERSEQEQAEINDSIKKLNQPLGSRAKSAATKVITTNVDNSR